MCQLLQTLTETINTLFPVVNFLKCVVTEVVFLQPPVPAYAGTEGCYRLLVFFIIFFIKRVIFETAESTLAPNMAGRRAWLGRSCP